MPARAPRPRSTTDATTTDATYEIDLLAAQIAERASLLYNLLENLNAKEYLGVATLLEDIRRDAMAIGPQTQAIRGSSDRVTRGRTMAPSHKEAR